jgi:hypothetical protein
LIDTVTGVNCKLCDVIISMSKNKTDCKGLLLPYLGTKTYMELIISKAEKNKKEKEGKLK